MAVQANVIEAKLDFTICAQTKYNKLSYNLVPNQNICRLVIGRTGKNKWGQMKLLHLLPNQNKWHLVIG
jgi:hypothetical protein